MKHLNLGRVSIHPVIGSLQALVVYVAALDPAAITAVVGTKYEPNVRAAVMVAGCLMNGFHLKEADSETHEKADAPVISAPAADGAAGVSAPVEPAKA